MEISDIYDFVKQDDGTYKYDLDAVEGASLIITPSKEDLSGNMTLQIKSTVKSSGLNATSLDLTFELIMIVLRKLLSMYHLIWKTNQNLLC